jgi:hypothetical protein
MGKAEGRRGVFEGAFETVASLDVGLSASNGKIVFW